VLSTIVVAALGGLIFGVIWYAVAVRADHKHSPAFTGSIALPVRYFRTDDPNFTVVLAIVSVTNHGADSMLSSAGLTAAIGDLPLEAWFPPMLPEKVRAIDPEGNDIEFSMDQEILIRAQKDLIKNRAIMSGVRWTGFRVPPLAFAIAAPALTFTFTDTAGNRYSVTRKLTELVGATPGYLPLAQFAPPRPAAPTAESPKRDR
jgi:hypothetical protein